ncbi:helix-turn-helix domain-containing protein [Paraburkholderia sp. HD33-4]|uniref:helix-turn-helix domain-containing protein n=1 Tax=Paraburkholderia sp. HD33-4 TaxID=2883242 RepID=UPI001F39B7C6|nr:helix-turn-helix domain-containing protein [Paraburkholderia sp. HD33-4]
MSDFYTHIRPECLVPWVQGWKQPTGVEVREVIRRAGLTGSEAAVLVGLSGKGASRQIRRWISGESHIPYAAWALLCHAAGLGNIWLIQVDEMRELRREHPVE